MRRARYIIRDVATRNVDHLAWADELADALAALAEGRERLGGNAVELVLMPARLLDAHARPKVRGEFVRAKNDQGADVDYCGPAE